MKNKIYIYQSKDSDNNPVLIEKNGQEILDMIWYDWCYNMTITNREEYISEENCINDFIITMKAYEKNN